jgi:hypothetical protein
MCECVSSARTVACLARRVNAQRRAFALVVVIAAMHAKAFVFGLTVLVAVGGGYLYRATRGPRGAASSAPAPSPSADVAPATAIPRAARPLDAVAPVAPPTGATAPAVGATPVAGTTPGTAAPLPVGTPGVHLDVRDRFDDAPGVADLSDHARADLASPPPLAPEAAEALTEARAAFRRGDYAAARGTARKLLATAPDNDAARRLAVSSSCRLRDAASARTDAAAIAADQRAAVVRYCATAGVSLDAAP